MTTRTWKVYGTEGHRQKESFNDSYRYDFTNDTDGTRIIEVENSDKTGTNDYTLVRITRDTAKQCEEELDGQLTDGIFENYHTGRIEEVEMKIYFENNNAYRNVIFTDGETAKIFNGTGDGKFDGIYLYDEDIDLVIERLKKYFAEADLNDYDEINGDLTVDYDDIADGIEDMVEIY